MEKDKGLLVKKSAKFLPPPPTEYVEFPPITLGVVVEGVIIEKFQVNTPRLAALFLSNPTFVEVEQ